MQFSGLKALLCGLSKDYGRNESKGLVSVVSGPTLSQGHGKLWWVFMELSTQVGKVARAAA